MSGSNDHNQNGLRVVSGSFFHGTPFHIALENVTVGKGSSARIRKGYVLGDDPFVVAVKVFGELLDDTKQQLLSRELHFAREVAITHPSIVAFIGTATLGEQTAIVSLYMENGNLMQYFKAHPKCNKKLLIVQVADAVEFLHVNKKLVHGDLKCENVLVSDYGDALLADFGLSSFVEKSEGLSTTMTAIRSMHTLQFAAPEILGLVGDSDTPVSKKTTQSDMYAFGMLVLEAISEQPPWGKKNNAAVITSVSARKHPPRPTQDGTFVTMSHSWWDVCRSCWNFVSHERPPISYVLRTLKATESAPYWELLVDEVIKRAAYMPDGRTIVAVSSASVMLIDTTLGHIRERWRDGPWSDSVLLQLAVSPNGLHIACGCNETIRVLDAASGALMASLQHDGIVTCVAYSADGTRIASGYSTQSSGGIVRLWDGDTGSAGGQCLPEHTDRIASVSFSPDGSCLASADHSGTIRLWDTRTCTLMATLERPGREDLLRTVILLPDGMHIAAMYDDAVVLFRDVRASATMKCVWQRSTGTFAGNISPSGRYIATVSDNNTIQIWDVQDECQVGDPLIWFDERNELSPIFSPDERSLCIADLSGTLRVYDLFD